MPCSITYSHQEGEDRSSKHPNGDLGRRCSEDFSLAEKREEMPVKYEEAWRWIMGDELIFDRAMSPEIPESYAGQRRAEADE
jgi:hypothetical protein